MSRFLLYVVSLFLCSIGLCVIVINFNLIMYGYGFKEFLISVISRLEFYLGVVGLFLFIKKR